VARLGTLFGHLFGDSASEYESRGDQFASVNNWRRAHEEYERASHKTPRGSTAYRRVAAKLDDARTQSFEALIEDIHSRLDVREFTYATDQIEAARRLAHTSAQLARVEECEQRLRGANRYEKRDAASQPGVSAPGRERTPAPAARLDPAAVGLGNGALAGAARLQPAPAPAPQPTPAAAAVVQTEKAFRDLVAHLPAHEVERRVALGPSYWDAMLALSHGVNDGALQQLVRLHVENPGLGFLVYDLGAALVAIDRLRDAEELYAARMHADPDDWQAPYELAKLFWQRGAGDLALRTLEEASEQHPHSGHIEAQWGIFLHRIGARHEALQHLYRALELNEFDDAGLYHTIANLHRELGQHAEARDAYVKSLQLNAHAVGTKLDFAEFLIEDSNDGRAALDVLETIFRSLRSAKSAPLYPVYAAYLSSRAHLLLGEREMALLSVSRALQDNDQDWLIPKLEAQRQAVLAV
jgi:tetratricopeptide (TPR) repeat protein